MAKSNPRYECTSPTCNARITRNQLRGSNGICIYCKTPMAHTAWMGSSPATLGQLLAIPKSEEAHLARIAKSLNVTPAVIIGSIISLKLFDWENSEDIEKTVMQDLTLAKLSRS